ncbi:MAG: hypothetical protein K2X50_06530 [Gammaproteobacteria bacterium]|nr:hypothetical protein [Gammaproteobacteria bacterium]
MQGKPRELSAEEKALLAKFDASSFGKLRKDFISALEDAASNSFGLENATIVCGKIKPWLHKNPAATPAEIFRQLTNWLTDAKLDEGFGKGTRNFINKLVDIFTTHTNLIIDSITNKELASLDAPAPSAQSAKVQSQDQSHLKLLEDLRAEIAIFKGSITTLELEKSSLSSKVGSQSREIDNLSGEIAQQKTELSQLRKTNQDGLITLESNKFQLEQLKQAVKALEELRDRLTKEADADKVKIREQAETIASLNVSNIQLKATDGSKDALIAQLKEDSLAQKTRIEKLEAELQQLRQTSYQATSENATLKARLEAAEAARDKSAAELDTIRSAKETIAVEKGRVDGKLEATEKTNQDLIARETVIVEKMIAFQAAHQEAESHVREAGQVIHRLMTAAPEAPTHEARIQLVEESFSNVSVSGRKALGLNESIREIKQHKAKAPKTQAPGHSAAQAAGQAGHFKTPGAKTAAVATAPATGNGQKITKIADAKTSEEALEFLKPKIVGKDRISEVRFEAILAISKFLTKYLTDKGVIKPDANNALYKSLVDATKLLVAPDANTIESVYKKLNDEKPGDLTEPLLNEYNEVLTTLAVTEPQGEKFQTPIIYWALANFFVKVAQIKDMSTHFTSIYTKLNPAPANGINTSVLDATKDLGNTTVTSMNGGPGSH